MSVKTTAVKPPPDITVVMPSYLGEYQNSATNRVEKFHRAINSVFQDKDINVELLVISDGCDITSGKAMHNDNDFRVIYLRKQAPFSGTPRNYGIDIAHAPIICYLDTDDMFLPGHLRAVLDGFAAAPYADWVYYDDHVAGPHLVSGMPEIRYTRGTDPLVMGNIGTSSIAHRKACVAKCRWTEGYGHDFEFVKQLVEKYPNYKKIDGGGYLVCHLPGGVDV